MLVASPKVQPKHEISFSTCPTLDLSIIVLNWNTRQLLYDCLMSIQRETQDISHEIWVVDNASVDGSVMMVTEHFPVVQVIVNTENVGFARANNQAIRESRGRYILLLNSDTVVLDGALQKMVRQTDTMPQVGAVGCKVLRPDNTVQLECARGPYDAWTILFGYTFLDRLFSQSRLFGRGKLSYWNHNTSREVDTLLGAFMMVRREVVEAVGGLDEDFFLSGEDVDWCIRIQKAGWKIFYYADAYILHYQGRSFVKRQDRSIVSNYQSMLWLIKKHYGLGSVILVRLGAVVGSVLRACGWLWILLRSATRERREDALLRMLANAKVACLAILER